MFEPLELYCIFVMVEQGGHTNVVDMTDRIYVGVEAEIVFRLFSLMRGLPSIRLK